jgi:hypothetical protein
MKKPASLKGRKGPKGAPKKADAEMWAKPEMKALDSFTRDLLKVPKSDLDKKLAKERNPK